MRRPAFTSAAFGFRLARGGIRFCSPDICVHKHDKGVHTNADIKIACE